MQAVFWWIFCSKIDVDTSLRSYVSVNGGVGLVCSFGILYFDWYCPALVTT